MRVCLVAPALPPAVGGAEVVADSVIRGLLGAGVEVDVVTGTRSPALQKTVESAGGRVMFIGRELPMDCIPWEFDTFARSEALWELFQARVPDVVHVFSHDAALAVGVAAPTAPIVGTFSEMATEQGGFGSARSRFVYAIPGVRMVTAATDYYASVAVRHGFAPSRVRRVMTGVDVDYLRSGRASRGRTLLGLRSEGPVVLCPSRFTLRKGQLDLLEAVVRIRQRNVQLLLLGSVHSGSSDYLREVRERVAELRIGHFVRIMPGLPHRDMADVYAACDVVVQPSHAEGLGLSALEAMAIGKPLLATRVSGFDQFLAHEKNALVVPPGDPEALADQLARLLDDTDLCARLTDQAQADVRREFGIGRTVRELLSVYREVIGNAAFRGANAL